MIYLYVYVTHPDYNKRINKNLNKLTKMIVETTVTQNRQQQRITEDN